MWIANIKINNRIEIVHSFFYFPMTKISLEISSLEEAHKISMLIYLYKNGRSKKTDIYSCLPQNANLAKKLSELEDKGLVVLDPRRFENNTTYVELTARGREVARKLVEIEEILSDKSPGPGDDFSAPSAGEHMMPI